MGIIGRIKEGNILRIIFSSLEGEVSAVHNIIHGGLIEVGGSN
jgi:hypothetical protein